MEGVNRGRDAEDYWKNWGKSTGAGQRSRNARAARLRNQRRIRDNPENARMFGNAFGAAGRTRGRGLGGMAAKAAMFGAMMFGPQVAGSLMNFGGDDTPQRDPTMVDHAAGWAASGLDLASFMPKSSKRFLTRSGMGIGAKIAGKTGMKFGAKLGAGFIPGVGLALDTYQSGNAFMNHQNLAGGLYGAAAALNGAGLAADSTGVGALAGIPLDAIGGVLNFAGQMAEATHFGDHLGDGWFGGKKGGSVSKEAARVAQKSAAMGSALQSSAATPQTDQNMAMLVEHQKKMSKLAEQQTGILDQMKDFLKKIAKSSKDTADNV
jgi:hypothetical protein